MKVAEIISDNVPSVVQSCDRLVRGSNGTRMTAPQIAMTKFGYTDDIKTCQSTGTNHGRQMWSLRRRIERK